MTWNDDNLIDIPNATVKSRAIAIVLAIIFGFFSWIYTYSRNLKKFWIALAIMFISTLANVYFLKQYFSIITWINFAIFRVWPVIDYSIKKDSFYKNYPNG